MSGQIRRAAVGFHLLTMPIIVIPLLLMGMELEPVRSSSDPGLASPNQLRTPQHSGLPAERHVIPPPPHLPLPLSVTTAGGVSAVAAEAEVGPEQPQGQRLPTRASPAALRRLYGLSGFHLARPGCASGARGVNSV